MLNSLTSCASWSSRLTSALVSPQHATESLLDSRRDYWLRCLLLTNCIISPTSQRSDGNVTNTGRGTRRLVRRAVEATIYYRRLLWDRGVFTIYCGQVSLAGRKYCKFWHFEYQNDNYCADFLSHSFIPWIKWFESRIGIPWTQRKCVKPLELECFTK